MTLDPQGRARWLQLSPLLDELLDLDPAARAARLAELRAQDEAVADDLARLLAEDEALQAQGFLAQPAAEALQGAMEEAEATAPDLAGQPLGPYVLERELGQGGMGAVWLDRRADGRFEGQVAVKFLKTALFGAGARFGTLGGDHAGSRFAREGQILARLSHPHIARLLDAGVFEGQQPYLVLEYVDGLPIDRYCEQHQLGVDARVKLFLDVLAAVAHAHSRLILHRDLKPSNILVNAQGEVKLLDFGIAKLLDDSSNADATRLTELTQRVGNAFTPQYAAPEQVQQLEVTTATDVYALGVLLYVLLGGRHPTADATQKQLDRLKALVELVPKRLSEAAAQHPQAALRHEAKRLRGDLDTILAKALKKAPTERYPNAQALADDLQHWLAHEPISARPDSRWYVASRFVRRHRAAVAATSVALLALVSLTIFSVLEAHRAERAELQAEARRQQSDDLLAYMLGDFADKLRPIGKLDLLDSIGGRALKHLTAEAPTHAAERLNRAKALTVIGEVRVTRREFDTALEALRPAQALLEGDSPAAEMVADWYKAQGAAHFWAGQAAYLARDMEAAGQNWRRYLVSAERMLAERPTATQAVLEVSYARIALGSLALRLGRLPEAIESFKESAAVKRRAMLGESPEQLVGMRAELASTLSWLGQSYFYGGQLEEAIDAWRQSLRELAKASETKAPSANVKYTEAVVRNWLAEALAEAERLAEARQEAGRSTAAMRELIETDSSNRSWQVTFLLGQAIALEISTLETPQLLKALDRFSHDLGEFEAKASVRRVHDHIRAARLEARLTRGPARERALGKLRSLRLRLNKELDASPGQMGPTRSLAQIDMDLFRYEDPAKIHETCALALEDAKRMQAWVGVDYVVTAYWRKLQRCEAAKDLKPSVEDARTWLANSNCGVLCTQSR